MLTTREVIKTFYNALLQRLKKHRGDWNQNDPTADDYIKNRPFYTDENDKTVNVPEQKITIPSKRPYSAQLILPKLIEFVVGQTYDVKWDDETYSCAAFDLNGISVIGNRILFDDGTGTDTGEPLIMMISKAEGFGAVVAPKAIGTHTVEVTTTKVVTLNRKYIPDLGLAPVATSGNYYDLKNAPTVYSDVVRYNAGQSLSRIQKEQARENIGAISSDEVTGVVKYTAQSLTDTQKAQARTNIGAGTSSFSGSYNDLTEAPVIDTTLTVEGAAADAKAVGDVVTQLNTPKDYIILIDQINGYHYIACMRNGNFVTYCATKSIEVTAMPTKTEYTTGEYFDPAGMTVVATAYDGTTKEITDFICPSSYILDNDTFIEIKAGITHIATVPITINPFDPAIILIDFNYTDNGDDTYTITGWKGTYNGEASTEIIIPDNGLIRV